VLLVGEKELVIEDPWTSDAAQAAVERQSAEEIESE
jgi:hypothetical protein